MLQKVSFKDKNKNSANPTERTLTDVNINELKNKLNQTIDRVNCTITDGNGNFLNYYTKQQTEQLIQAEKDELVEEIADEIADEISNEITSDVTSAVVERVAPKEYISQLNFDLSMLLDKIEDL